VADGLLDGRRVDVHPADDRHVVGPPDDPAGEPARLVSGRAALLGVHDRVAGPVAQHREAGPAKRGQDQLAALALRGRVELLVEDLADELVLEHMQAVALRARVPEWTGLGQPRVVDAGGAEAFLDPLPHGGERRARLARADHQADRVERGLQALLDGDLQEAQRIGGRAPDRRGLDVRDRLKPLGRGHAAHRDGHGPDLVEPLVGSPELHVGPERVGERHAVGRVHAAHGQRVREQPAPPGPVVGGVEHVERRAGCPARLPQAGVALEGVGEVGPERGMVGLVGDQLALGQGRQVAQVGVVADVEGARPLALERVALEDQLEQARLLSRLHRWHGLRHCRTLSIGQTICHSCDRPTYCSARLWDAAREEVTYSSCARWRAKSWSSPSGERWSIEVIQAANCCVRQTRRRHVSE
jgi:hypothetical protein